MQKNTKILRVLLLIFSFLAISFSAFAAEPYLLKIGSVTNETHPYYVIFQKVFVPYIEKEAPGRIKIEFYFNAQLGGDREMVEMCQMGALGMDCATPSTLSGFEKRFQVLGLPYLFHDKATAFRALDGELGQVLNSYLPAINLYNLGYFENGFRHVTNNKKPIESIDDMKSLKIRTQENPMHIAFFRAIGASPSPLNWGELYTALQQGTFDAQETPLVLMYEARFYEVQKFVSMTAHVYEPTMLITSKIWFDSLPEDLQKIVREAARLFCEEERKYIHEKEQTARAKLEEHGMKVNDIAPEQLAAFAERSRKLYDESRPLLGDEIIDLAIKATSK